MPELLQIPPMDEYNQALVRNAHPPEWVNPVPSGRYNLVVIGGGTAGLVTAIGASGLGAKVALVERHLLGGDCLNYGCVPSKSVLRSAHAASAVRSAGCFGVRVPDGTQADFPATMQRMRRVRSTISEHDSARRCQSLGVDVFLGEARFTGDDTVEVSGETLRFARGVIATGARAAHPPIDGLGEAGFLTNETVFSLTERPRRLGIVGGGPLGCEMAQAFGGLGSEVTVVENADQLLTREDREVAEILMQGFRRDSIDVRLNTTLRRVTVADDGKRLHLVSDGKEDVITVDEILVAVGRAPNVEELNLETAGVRYDKRKGVLVDDRLRTTNRRIYAAGDVCMRYKFTHAADAAARIVIQNALFFGRKKLSALTVPWCTYTDPAIARVGLCEKDAEQNGIEVQTFVRGFKDVDRGVTDGETEGLVKVLVKKGTDRILGATIVARSAGDMIGEITLAMVNRIGLGKIAQVIHPYPTRGEAIKQIGDDYNRTRLTPLTKKLFTKFLSWRR